MNLLSDFLRIGDLQTKNTVKKGHLLSRTEVEEGYPSQKKESIEQEETTLKHYDWNIPSLQLPFPIDLHNNSGLVQFVADNWEEFGGNFEILNPQLESLKYEHSNPRGRSIWILKILYDSEVLRAVFLQQLQKVSGSNTLVEELYDQWTKEGVVTLKDGK